MNMHRNIIASQWEAALANLDQSITARDIAIAAFLEATKLHEAARPIDDFVAMSPIGDTIEAYSERCREAKAAHERAEAAWRANPSFRKARSSTQTVMEEFDAALAVVLELPAPNLAALARKLKLAAEQGVEISDLGGVFADLDRLQLAA